MKYIITRIEDGTSIGPVGLDQMYESTEYMKDHDISFVVEIADE